MASEVDLLPEFAVMHEVLAPLGLPLLRLESHGKRASHLDCFADRQIGSGFMVEKTENLIIEVHRSTGELNARDRVVLPESESLHFLLEFC